MKAQWRNDECIGHSNVEFRIGGGVDGARCVMNLEYGAGYS